MSGYNPDWKMSNNAVRDIKRGIVPYYYLPIPLDLLTRYLPPTICHHIGPRYLKTNFYHRKRALAFFGLIKSEKFPTNERASEELENRNRSTTT